MQQDQQMLNQIRQTTKMGQVGIQAVLGSTSNESFRNALASQLAEYNLLYQQADQLLQEHGGTRKNLNPLAAWGSTMASKMKLKTDDSVSRIAQMMVEGNTKGMIKSIQSIRSMGVLDPKVSALSHRLLQTEQANIDQMKGYL